jgi:hypothetical protein
MEEFDVVVVGAGPAGEVIAGRCADGGLRVALVERDLVGGECSYWGCVPSKTLIRPGDVLAAAQRVPGASEAVTGQIDVDAALAQRDYMTSNWHDDGQLPWLDEHKITLARGSGRLDGNGQSWSNGTAKRRGYCEPRKPSCCRPGPARRCPRSTASPRPGRGTTATSPPPRKYRGDWSCWVVARSVWRWRKDSAASAAKR